MWRATLLLYLIHHNAESLIMTDICDPHFAGTKSNTCTEYGFCSSCVSNGNDCYWCDTTSRCLNSLDGYYNCPSEQSLSSLAECSSITDINRENPNIFTTEYSTRIAEIMAIYSSYAYPKKFEPYEDWETFNLNADSIKIINQTIRNMNIEYIPLPKSIIQGYVGTYDAEGSEVEYNYTRFVKFVNELVDILTDDFNLGSWLTKQVKKVADMFNDQAMNLPKSNVLGEQRVVVGLDHTNRAIVTSFRGTTSDDDQATLKSEILFAGLTRWDKSDISDIMSLYNSNAGVTISGYFSTAYNILKETVDESGKTFYEYVKQYIAMYADYDLYITGHSLGGVQRITNLCFMQKVEHRGNQSLVPLIHERHKGIQQEHLQRYLDTWCFKRNCDMAGKNYWDELLLVVGAMQQFVPLVF